MRHGHAGPGAGEPPPAAGAAPSPLVAWSAGLGLASERRGLGLRASFAERGGSSAHPAAEREAPFPLPTPGGRRILVSLLGFSVSCKTLGLRGPGCERWDRAPPAPRSCRKAPAWGRDPAGATWAGAGVRPPLSPCPSARAGAEGLLPGGSTDPPLPLYVPCLTCMAAAATRTAQ